MVRALLDDVEDGRRRDRDDREVDLVGDVEDRRVGADTGDGRRGRVDGI